MIIIASISVMYFADVLDDANYDKARVELKDVETVIESAKLKILTSDFVPNSSYIASLEEVKNKFGTVLSDEEIDYIQEINSNSNLSDYSKFYIMNQKRFDDEFKNEVSVKDLSTERDYLINYMDSTVVINFGGSRMSNSVGDSLIKAKSIERGSIKVTFDPNGNSTWYDKQITQATVESINSAASNIQIRYLWSQSYTEPTESEFNGTNSGTYVSNTLLTLSNVTGNDWYLWLKVTYQENGTQRTSYFRSNPFFLDNVKPSAILDVDEITR